MSFKQQNFTTELLPFDFRSFLRMMNTYVRGLPRQSESLTVLETTAECMLIITLTGIKYIDCNVPRGS